MASGGLVNAVRHTDRNEEAPPLRRHLRLAEQPQRPTGVSRLALALTVSGAMIVSGAGVYGWQHAQLVDSRRATAAANERATANAARAATLELRVEALTGRVGILSDRSARLRNRADPLEVRIATTTGRRDVLAGRLADTRASLAHARGRLSTMLGPPIASGTYTARVLTVSPRHEPPLIAVRIYGRNGVEGGWRLLEASSDAGVGLVSWRSAPATVDLPTFAHIIGGVAPWNATMRSVGYRVVVDDGIVTAIHEIAS